MNFTKYLIAGKDYVYIDYADKEKEGLLRQAVGLCDRVKGTGADGFFTFQQNNHKNGQISGLLQNGQIMRDFSSASICACFDAFSKTDAAGSAFSFKNAGISEVICDFAEDMTLIYCRFSPSERSFPADTVNRRTEIGNRILTVTPIYISGIHGVHFTECINQLDINYLGSHFSRNSLFQRQADFILAQKTDSCTYEIAFYENGTGCPRPALSSFISTALAAINTGRQKFNERISIICGGSFVSVICRNENTFEISCEVRKILEGNT